jgi:hypothetical protein
VFSSTAYVYIARYLQFIHKPFLFVFPLIAFNKFTAIQVVCVYRFAKRLYQKQTQLRGQGRVSRPSVLVGNVQSITGDRRLIGTEFESHREHIPSPLRRDIFLPVFRFSPNHCSVRFPIFRATLYRRSSGRSLGYLKNNFLFDIGKNWIQN